MANGLIHFGIAWLLSSPRNVYAASLLPSSSSLSSRSSSSPSCENLKYAVDKCAFVLQHCNAEKIGFINYLKGLHCAETPADSVAFQVASLLWLVCLFMTIGIAAYDFLCPNLKTVASILGLSESVVGVTFLAFGNGSPDMFSTYAAMKIGSGSLAVGELLGAASFITAVVAGSMAVVRPFKVLKASFVRDVLFFIVSIAFTLYFVSDGQLQPWECMIMLSLYLAYVIFVVGWHWYKARRRASVVPDIIARDFYSEPDSESVATLTQNVNNDNEINFGSSRPSVSSDISALFSPQWLDDEQQNESQQQEGYEEITRIMRMNSTHGRSHSPENKIKLPSGNSTPSPAIRPSLFGALEFRSVVEKLRKEAADTGSPDIPLRKQDSSRVTEAPPSQASSVAVNSNLWTQGHFPLLRANADSGMSRVHLSVPNLIVTGDEDSIQSPTSNVEAGPLRIDTLHDHTLRPAVIPSPIASIHSIEDHFNLNKEPPMILKSEVLATLLPSLVDFSDKPWYTKITSIIAAPWVLLLTLTIPVHDVDMEPDIPLSPTATMRSPRIPHKTAAKSARWLLILQAVFAPMAFAFFNLYSHDLHWSAIFAFSCSTSLVLLVLILVFESHESRHYVNIIPFVGFILGISWIAAIANEVVGVLKALGIYYNISDAVLGLTVFAIGNSLGDFFANVMIAKMGFPMMALSACFGGPLLNILAGIGFSGLFLFLGEQNRGPYQLSISRSLIVSGIAVLSTLLFLLVVVPLNGWRMTRPIGLITISFWIICTSMNVILELI